MIGAGLYELSKARGRREPKRADGGPVQDAAIKTLRFDACGPPFHLPNQVASTLSGPPIPPLDLDPPDRADRG